MIQSPVQSQSGPRQVVGVGTPPLALIVEGAPPSAPAALPAQLTHMVISTDYPMSPPPSLQCAPPWVPADNPTTQAAPAFRTGQRTESSV